MFSYVGSKRKELKHIKDYYLNDIDKFIDVFGGSGCVGLDYYKFNPDIKKLILNDKSEVVYNLYNIIKNDKFYDIFKKFEPFINKFKDEYKNDKKYNNTLKEFKEQFTEEEKFILCGKYCYKGNLTPELFNVLKMKDITNMQKKKNFSEVLNKNNISLKNKDFKYYMEKYKNNENVLIYLDPPYLDTKHLYNEIFTLDDYLYILECLKNYKCKILLNININTHLILEYRDYIEKIYPICYNSSVKAKNKEAENFLKLIKKNHLILTNYKVTI